MKLSTYIIIIFFVLLNDKAKAQPIDFELTTSKEVKYKLKDSTNGVKAIGLIGNNVYYHHYIRTANLATEKKNFVTKERVRNNFVIYAASFALIFDFENSHYIIITPTFKAKTKNKISYPNFTNLFHTRS